MSYKGKLNIISIQPYASGLYDVKYYNEAPIPPPINVDVLSTEDNVIFIAEQNEIFVVV